MVFSGLACLVILAFSLRPQKVISLLGLILTPILLVALGVILVIGFTPIPSRKAWD